MGGGNRVKKKSYVPATPVQMMKALCLMTETGYPAHISIVRDCYGKGVKPALEEGWFWIGATEKSYADISRRGLHARGTVMTTFIPPQAPVVIEQGYQPSDVPAIGSSEFLEQVHLDTEERRERMIERREARESHESSMP
jgi:hypothetical protein